MSAVVVHVGAGAGAAVGAVGGSTNADDEEVEEVVIPDAETDGPEVDGVEVDAGADGEVELAADTEGDAEAGVLVTVVGTATGAEAETDAGNSEDGGC
jgi:hypothetical protein